MCGRANDHKPLLCAGRVISTKFSLKRDENSKFTVQDNGSNKMTFVKSDNALSIIQKKFKIDYSKVESLEQVIDILKAMDLSIHWYNDDCPEQFKDLYEKGLLIAVK